MPDSRLVLANFLPFRLSVLSNMVSSAIAAGYAERCGISIPEWRVIAVLAESPGLAAAEVAARTVMDKVAVSRAVATLLAKRHIHRSQSRRDRRRRRVEQEVPRRTGPASRRKPPPSPRGRHREPPAAAAPAAKAARPG